jgi:NAD(P)-dependent dehydrogenase (short-subunit alcohol dehydrogenase family)
MTEKALLSGRVALVTGASRGIGRATAVALGEAGAHVILVARSIEGLEEVDDRIRSAGSEATLVPLDLKDFDALDRMGAAIFERWGKLDALVGNAGILGLLTPIAHLQPKSWDELIAVNVTANFRLIRSCDPLLKRSDAARAVFVSSGAASKARPFWGGYAASKAALESLVLTYANECAGINVNVNLFNPGATRTKMRAQAMPGEDPMSLPAPEDIAPQIVELLLPTCTITGSRITATR